jgi:hypothetical protein
MFCLSRKIGERGRICTYIFRSFWLLALLVRHALIKIVLNLKIGQIFQCSIERNLIAKLAIVLVAASAISKARNIATIGCSDVNLSHVWVGVARNTGAENSNFVITVPKTMNDPNFVARFAEGVDCVSLFHGEL